MAKQYYLSNNGTHIGPFSVEAVLKKLDAHEHQWTDYIFDESVGDWMMLMEHPEFSSRVPSSTQAPSASPDPHAQFKDREWFLLKEGKNQGPYSPLEIVQMLQAKTLFEFDYIWHSKLPDWQRVAEIEDFSPDNIRAMAKSEDAELSEVFFRRRHARAEYGASLIVHDNKTVFRGRTLEISAGGAGILIETSALRPGQSLFLHFQPGDGVPPFNAVCQVVSKHFSPDAASADQPVKYGVKFVTLSQSARENIQNYTTAKAA